MAILCSWFCNSEEFECDIDKSLHVNGWVKAFNLVVKVEKQVPEFFSMYSNSNYSYIFIITLQVASNKQESYCESSGKL